MILIHRANDRSIRRCHQNRATIAANETTVDRRHIESTKNHHENAAQAVAAIAVATHGIQIVHENIQDEIVHRPMIEPADQVRAATNVINIQEKKATPEVIATKKVAIELNFVASSLFTTLKLIFIFVINKIFIKIFFMNLCSR